MTEFNRHTGEVALPEAGEGAAIMFTVQAFETLESAYGDDYIDLIVKGLAKVQVKMYQVVLAATVINGNAGAFPFGLRLEEVNIRILDALNLAIYGRTYQEQKDWQEEQMTKRLEGMEQNPQLATILSLMSAGGQRSDQG